LSGRRLWKFSQALASPRIFWLNCTRSSTEESSNLFLPHPVKALQKGLFIVSRKESSAPTEFMPSCKWKIHTRLRRGNGRGKRSKGKAEESKIESKISNINYLRKRKRTDRKR